MRTSAKRLFYFLILPIFLPVTIFVSSCNTNVTSEISETWPSGNVKIVEYYKKQDGRTVLFKTEEYYEDGALKAKGGISLGKRDGKWVTYYPEGGKWSEATYKYGNQHGKQTVYHPNGKKYYQGSFEDGIRIGTWSFWNKEGELVNTKEY